MIEAVLPMTMRKATNMLQEACEAGIAGDADVAFERFTSTSRLLLMAELAASTALDGPSAESKLMGDWTELQIMLSTNASDNYLFQRGRLAVAAGLLAMRDSHRLLARLNPADLAHMKLVGSKTTFQVGEDELHDTGDE